MLRQSGAGCWAPAAARLFFEPAPRAAVWLLTWAAPSTGPCAHLQHVLSVFRTQRVQRIHFDLSTADCRATVTLHCENGGRGDGRMGGGGLLQLQGGRWHRRRRSFEGPWDPPRLLPIQPTAGLTKSYRLPTLDSEILQVGPGCPEAGLAPPQT